MLNPFLTSNFWAMEEASLQAIAQQASAFNNDPSDDPESLPYEVNNGIAVMSLIGPILKYQSFYSMLFGGSSSLQAKQNLQQALDDPSVFATLIIVDSPGGEVPGTADLADVIAGATKPVWVYVSDTCCSAAYWIASQADKIFCNSTARVGSIGAYCVLLDKTKMYADAGVKATLVKAGAFKGQGADGTPVTQSQIDDQQRGIDAVYSMFVDAVAAGREMTNDAVMQIATGQVWQGQECLSLGLVDAVTTIEECFEQLSGEVMAGKISAFSVSKLGTTARVAETAPAAVVAEVVTPAVEAAPAVTIAEIAPVIAVAEPARVETSVDALLASARVEAVAGERLRLAQIAEVAPDHPAFVLEQFKAGADKGTAAVAYAKVLVADLKTAKAALASGVVEPGQKALVLGSVEKREDKTATKFIKFRK